MSEVVLAILAIAVVLAVVSVLAPLAERASLPVTAVLAVLGLSLGLIAIVGPIFEIAPIHQLTTGLASLHLSAEAILFLFLPPLLFSAGLAVDIRLLFDELAAVLLLAIVAVVVCTVVVGVTLDLFSDFGLLVCLLLGSVVATTDPAAVVVIFRDLGAKRRLSTLVANESLFNDATAIAIFAILMRLLTGGEEVDWAHPVAAFALDFLGGLALGYGLARITCWVVKRLPGSAVTEATASIALAYLSFILGEVHIGVSGVIATVVAAITFAVHGRLAVQAGGWDRLNDVWAQVEFLANSLIFVLAPMMTAPLLLGMGTAELGLLAMLILGTLAARAAVLWGLLPGLVALGMTEPVGHPHRIVILWGGLRGAVTLTLAVAVTESRVLDPETSEFVGVLATGFVFFTLLVSAPTLRPLLRLTGLDRLSPTERTLRDRVMALSRTSVREQLVSFARQYELPLDADLADECAPAPDVLGEHSELETAVRIDRATRTRVAFLAIANREKELYLEHYKEGTVSSRITGRLTALVDRTIDQVKTDGLMGYRRSSRRALDSGRSFRFVRWLHRRLGLDQPLAERLGDLLELLIVQELALRELDYYNDRTLRRVFSQEMHEQIGAAIAERRRAVTDAVGAIALQYPAYTDALRRKFLLRTALRLEETEYRRSLSEGLIGREVFFDLLADLRRRRHEAEQRPPLHLGLGLTDMLGRVPLLARLDRAKLLQIARLLTPRLALPHERLVKRGERGTEMYFIASGEVRVEVPGGPVKLGRGDFFGEIALLKRQRRIADVVAVGLCHLLVLNRRDFQSLLRQDAAIREAIETAAQQRLDLAREETTAPPP